MKTIRDYTTFSLHTIGADQPLEAAKKAMYQHGIRHLPVLDGGALVGVISDRDIKLATAVDRDQAKNLLVKDVCTGETYTAELQTPLCEVASYMASQGIGSAIITENGSVIGIFTVTDACRALAEETK